MPLKPPKIVDLDDPMSPRPTLPAEKPKPSRPRGATKRATTGMTPPPPRSAPAAGGRFPVSPKVTISMRAPTAAWEHLGTLKRRLEDEGLRTSATEITEALWHFHAPRDVDEARELIRRYRRAQLD